VYFDGLWHSNHGPLHHHDDGGSTLYGQKIHLSQFPEKHRRFDCPCLRQKVKLLNQNLKFTPSKPRSKPAQAVAAPGLHDQHLTIDAEAALTQAPTCGWPTVGGGYPDPGN